MGERDRSHIAAHGRPQHDHLAQAAGHAGEESGHRTVPADNAEIGVTQANRDQQVGHQTGQADHPLAGFAQDLGRKRAAQHDAKHSHHDRAQTKRQMNRRTHQRSDGHDDHCAQHPGKRQVQLPEHRAAQTAQGEREQGRRPDQARIEDGGPFWSLDRQRKRPRSCNVLESSESDQSRSVPASFELPRTKSRWERSGKHNVGSTKKRRDCHFWQSRPCKALTGSGGRRRNPRPPRSGAFWLTGSEASAR